MNHAIMIILVSRSDLSEISQVKHNEIENSADQTHSRVPLIMCQVLLDTIVRSSPAWPQSSKNYARHVTLNTTASPSPHTRRWHIKIERSERKENRINYTSWPYSPADIERNYKDTMKNSCHVHQHKSRANDNNPQSLEDKWQPPPNYWVECKWYVLVGIELCVEKPLGLRNSCVTSPTTVIWTREQRRPHWNCQEDLRTQHPTASNTVAIESYSLKPKRRTAKKSPTMT